MIRNWFLGAARSGGSASESGVSEKSHRRTATLWLGASAATAVAIAANISAISVEPSSASIPEAMPPVTLASLGTVSLPQIEDRPAIVRADRLPVITVEKAAPAGPEFHSASIDSRPLADGGASQAVTRPARQPSRILSSSPLPASDGDRRMTRAIVTADDAGRFHRSLYVEMPDPERFAAPHLMLASLSTGMSLLEGSVLVASAADDLARSIRDQEAEELSRQVEIASKEAEPAAAAPRVADKPATRPAATELAYAAPDEPEEETKPEVRKSLLSGFEKLFNRTMGMPGPGSGVAVYDITNAVVHMPNGQRLEAHSGLGHMQDKPKYSHVKMKGPTPPNVYNLRMREALFHGVEAIRMLPVDQKRMRGRDGILAHTYLLGRTKSSNGCLSFEHYDKFLAAFKRGEVTKIIVVPDMTHLPTYMAMLEPQTTASVSVAADDRRQHRDPTPR